MDKEISGHVRKISFLLQMIKPIPQLALFPLTMPPEEFIKEKRVQCCYSS